MNIVGLKKVNFVGKDGNQVTGMKVWVTEPINPKDGSGCSCIDFFLSSGKLSMLDFVPTVGASVSIAYNRYGRVDTIRLAEEAIDLA